jgi:hypothetical protein
LSHIGKGTFERRRGALLRSDGHKMATEPKADVAQSVASGSTRALGNSVKDACKAVVGDWSN